MNADVIKYTHTAFTLMPEMKMYTTLSDRLKQAGIRESKPEAQVKKDKNSKKRKPNFKSNYAPYYMGNGSQRSKKLRKPLKQFVLPYLKKPLDSDDVRGEIIPRDSVNPPEDPPETGKDISEKVTIFVSLDFIEDCQNYKKKVRKPSDDRPSSKSWGRSTRSTSSNPKQYPDKRGGSQKPQEEVGDRSLDCVQKQETRPETEDSPEGNHSNLNTKKECEAGRGLSGSIQSVQSSLSKLSSSDIAKIDRKYLESILSIAMSMERKENKKKLSEDESEETTNDSQPEKKKLPGKVFFERKVKAKDENFKKDDIKVSKNEEKTAQGLERNDARIVRDLTKSEEQIKLKRGKNSYGRNNFKVKSKIVTHSKPDFKDINRRKRKPGNKFKKTTIEEFIETSLPSEVSKVADVKELWRRKNQEKSENSLTSHSSCTVPETEEILGTKNLESYKVLKTTEMCNSSKGSENKDITGEVKNKESKTHASPKESEQAKKKGIASSENSTGVQKNVSILKKRLMQAGYNSECEGKVQKSQLLSFLPEDVPNEASPNLTRLKEKAKEGGKVPSQVIEKWSILNRLEQAFLGLGTPTFPNKNTNNSNFLRGKHFTGNGEGNASGKKLSADGVKENKRTQNNKEACRIRDTKSPGTPIPSYLRNRLENSGKTMKTIVSSTKLSDSKEKHQAHKTEKESKHYNMTEAVSKDSKPDENNSKHKVKKLLIRTDGLLSKKSRSYLSPSGPSKDQNLIKKKSSKTMAVKQKKNSGENLERKKTFDVLPETDTSSSVQPRRSRSFDPNGSKLEKRFSKNKIQISKKQDKFPQCTKEEQKLQSSSNENDASTRTTIVPKRLAKNPMKDKSLEVCENLKTFPERECQKENRGTVINPRGVVYQEKKTETTEKKKPHSGRTRPGRDSNNSSNRDKTTIFINENNKNTTIIIDDNSKTHVDTSTLGARIVKKRSILSMNANQHRNETHMKLVKIKETDNPYGTSKEINRQVIAWRDELKNKYSNTSAISSGTYDLLDNVQNYFAKKTNGEVDFCEALLISPKSTLSSINTTEFTIVQDDPQVEQTEGEWKTWRKKSRWEQDLSHYRAIVKEIMSQYRRIDGFLKQNEKWNNFIMGPGSSVAINVDASDELGGCDENINIHEYRKRIVSEYKEVPIFEYKSKMKQTEGNFSSDASQRKNNLLVVRGVNTKSDLDVKDYQPKVQRVLDSQLYVDKTVKRNEPKIKFRDKKSSLQECKVGGDEKGVCTEDWRRSCSTLISSLPQETPLVSSNIQTLSSASSLGNLTSISMMGYCQETESESFQD